MPLGTGRMGTMVWTTPSSIKMQINRVDVFGMDKTTHSFPRGNSTYGHSCAFVDINCVDYGEDVFSGPEFRQELSVYDGRMSLRGNDIEVELLAWMEKDVIAIKVTDNREHPSPISFDLRMLRYSMEIMGRNYSDTFKHINRVRTASHFAASQLHITDGGIALSQEFTENKYYNASAVGVKIVGRKSQARIVNNTTVRLTAAPEKGSFVALISSSSSFDQGENIVWKAAKKAGKAESAGYAALRDINEAWWHRFWARTFVHLSSKDGRADLVEKHYTWFKYLMASCSQGKFQPRFGGMLWSATADAKNWGAQYWIANQRCFYLPLPPTGLFNLMEPLYSQYSDYYDSYATAARQQWGSKGLWIPETTWFNGLELLPDDIAEEMRELYLCRKAWRDRSSRFRQYAEKKNVFNSRWNWGGEAYWGREGDLVYPHNPHAPFAYVTHIMSGTPQIAWYFWLKYEYTMDKEWLADRAYPMLKGAIEFYRNFPNLKKGKDGKYHIHHVNNNEVAWNIPDSLWDIAAIRGLTPVLLRASEILDRDADMRPVWRELLKNIAPLPTTARLGGKYSDMPERWVDSMQPPELGNSARPRRSCFLDFYDMATIATKDESIKRISNAAFDALYSRGISERTSVAELNRTPIVAARLGRARDAAQMVYNQLTCANQNDARFKRFRNRMTAKPGFGSIGAQRIGNASAALTEMLIQSASPTPGGNPEIHVFPAFPTEWDASFNLLARGAFLVGSSIRRGKVDFVEITSTVGGTCRLKNPWTGKAVTVYQNGKEAQNLTGSLLSFATAPGEHLVLVPMGAAPPAKVTVCGNGDR